MSTDNDTTELSQVATQVTSQKGNDERGTPTEFIRTLQNAIDGPFDLDPCSGAEPTPIAENRFTIDDNGLAQDWTGYETVYVNPPYSDLDSWLQKVHTEHRNPDEDAPNLIMVLVPGNTSTQWFHNYATTADYLTLIEGRLKFHGTDTSAPFASVLLTYSDNPTDDVMETLDSLGAVYTKTEVENATEQQRLDEMFTMESDGGAVATTSGSPHVGPSGGPTIRDVSDQAPAVPQGFIDITDLGIGDELTIELDDSVIGFPTDVPVDAHVRVLAGEPAGNARNQTPEAWNTVLTVDPETETYFVVYQDPNHLTNTKASVEIPGRGWRDVQLDTLYRVTSNELTAIEPYGEGTSYVA